MKLQYQATLGQMLGSGGLGSVIVSGLSSLFSGGSGVSEEAAALHASSKSWADYGSSVTVTPLNHGGGIAGREASSLLAVPSSLFENAGRFHSGRAPVLRPDEVPTILQKDEGVFTPEQMKALARGQGSTAVQINLINQSGQQMAAEQGQPRFDGEQMVLDIVLRAASRPGNFRDSMKGALS
jgi:hypothetical protein